MPFSFQFLPHLQPETIRSVTEPTGLIDTRLVFIFQAVRVVLLILLQLHVRRPERAVCSKSHFNTLRLSLINFPFILICLFNDDDSTVQVK